MPIGCPDVRVQQVAAWTRGMAAPIPVESATRQNTRRKGGVFFIVMSFIVMALYGGIPLDVNAPENPFTDARCSLGRRREVREPSARRRHSMPDCSPPRPG